MNYLVMHTIFGPHTALRLSYSLVNVINDILITIEASE